MLYARRALVVLCGFALAVMLSVSACQTEGSQQPPETLRLEVPVTRIVEQTVVVEVEVTRIVKETVLVPKEQTVLVTRVVPPTPRPQPVLSALGTVDTGEWFIEIVEVRSDLGMDTSRRTLAILVNVTNQGMQANTFVGNEIALMDSSGRKYESDFGLTLGAPRIYGTGLATRVSPAARAYTATVFDVPDSEKTFTIVPGRVQGWSGNISFSLD